MLCTYGDNRFDLVSRKIGTVVAPYLGGSGGMPTVGVGSWHTGANGNDIIVFTAPTTAVLPNITMAAITWKVGAAGLSMVTSTAYNANSGWRLDHYFSPNELTAGGVGSMQSNFSTSSNPQFYIASASLTDDTYHLTRRDLATGHIVRYQAAGVLTATAGDSQWCVGGHLWYGGWDGQIGLSYISDKYISPGEALAWAQNPWQIFAAPKRRRVFAPAAAGGDVIVTPGFGNLTLTGYAPTVSATDGTRAIDTGLGNLSLTGYAPTLAVTEHQFASPGLGELVVTGYAPTVQVSGATIIATGLGELVLTGYAPTVTRTEHVIVNPETGALVITGYAPTVIQGGSFSVSPELGNLILTGYAPTVINSGDIVPSAGQTPAGSAAKRRDQRRRRIILPDGTLIWATFDEAYDILQAYTKPVEQKETQPDSKRVSRETKTRPIERREVKWVPVQDTITETYKPLLPARLEFMPSGQSYRIAMETMRRRMDDEEAAMVLLLH